MRANILQLLITEHLPASVNRMMQRVRECVHKVAKATISARITDDATVSGDNSTPFPKQISFALSRSMSEFVSGYVHNF